MLPVIEEFISIDGEGPTAGELAYFVRFAGCNLRCRWCDTAYSWDAADAIWTSAEEIAGRIFDSGIRNVTLTGGEPLLQAEVLSLLRLLSAKEPLKIHVETNGAIDIRPWKQALSGKNISYILDYKLPGSGMESNMIHANLTAVETKDAYKFVIASAEDLYRAIAIVKAYNLTERCMVYFSLVREEIDPAEIVDAMKKECLNKVRLQLQLHKIIWPKELRGV